MSSNHKLILGGLVVSAVIQSGIGLVSARQISQLDKRIKKLEWYESVRQGLRQNSY